MFTTKLMSSETFNNAFLKERYIHMYIHKQQMNNLVEKMKNKKDGKKRELLGN